MDWISTPESSNIAQFAYDDESGTLFIEFQKGGIYQYFDVPRPVFDAMGASASKGQFFSENVRGVFRFSRA
jgi:hypothetical protein